jgi:spermidine synthase
MGTRHSPPTTPTGPKAPEDTIEPDDAIEPEIEMVGASGTFDGRWYTEEDNFSSRLGIRVTARLHQERSEYQHIAVYDTPFFGRVLTLDGLVMLTERDEFVYHEMLTHVPLLSIPEPRSMLVIGGGDCGIVREALRHPSIERVVQCEIDERVTRVAQEHFAWVDDVIRDPRTELRFEDGIPFMAANREAFDLVVVDSTDPVGAAKGLFHRDFYREVAAALRDGGVMAAQTESPHWSPELVGPIYAEIGDAFAHVHPYLGFIPTYPSGCWCWAYASNHRTPSGYFDEARAEEISRDTRYYHPGIQRAAFVLPRFAEEAVAGRNPFARFAPPDAE